MQMRAMEPGPVPVEEFDGRAWSGLEELRVCLRTYLIRLCSDEHDVEDTIQETFLRAARYRLHHRVAHLRPWLLRIAQNVLADGRRRQARTGLTLKGEDTLDLPEVRGEGAPQALCIAGGLFEREAARELVRRGLGRLNTDDHALLEAYYSGGGDLARAAQESGVSRRLVKVRLYRARRKLREVVRREVRLHRRLGLAS